MPRPHKAQSRAGCKPAALLSCQDQGKLTLANAQGEPLGETGGGFFPIGRDEFGKGSKQACLRKAIAVDALDPGLLPCLVQVRERSPLLLMVKSLPLRLAHRYFPYHFAAGSPRPFRSTQSTHAGSTRLDANTGTVNGAARSVSSRSVQLRRE